MGRDLASNNPPQENRTCLQSAVSSCEASLMCLKTAAGASCSSHQSDPEPEPGGSGKPALVTPWWLQPCQLLAGIAPPFQGEQCHPKKASHEGQQGANPIPLPCSATHALGWVSAEPRACCGVRPGVMSSGLRWQLLSHCNNFPTAETRSVSLQGPSVPAAQLPFSWGHIQVDRVPHLSYI